MDIRLGRDREGTPVFEGDIVKTEDGRCFRLIDVDIFGNLITYPVDGTGKTRVLFNPDAVTRVDDDDL